jgi:hypothetical protein
MTFRADDGPSLADQRQETIDRLNADLLRMAEEVERAQAAEKLNQDAAVAQFERAEAAEAKLAEIHAYAKIPRDNGGHPKNYELFRERIATLSAQEPQP